MALQMIIQTKHGVELPQAYIQVVATNLNFKNERAWITINIFRDQAARQADLQPLEIKEYRVYSIQYKEFFNITTLSSEPINVIMQSYNFLKSLSEFATATDIIEESDPTEVDPTPE